MQNDESTQAPTLFEVLGRNLRTIREGNGDRQDDVAKTARGVGLRWTRATVAAVEAGTRSVTLPEVVLLALSMNVGVDELLSGDGEAELVPGTKGQLPAVRALLAGDLAEVKPFGDFTTPMAWFGQGLVEAFNEQVRLLNNSFPGATIGQIEDAQAASHGEAEQKAGRKLHCGADIVAFAALGLWGHSLSEERDARVAATAPAGASPRTLQSLRGHVTRELLVLLRQRIDEGKKGES